MNSGPNPPRALPTTDADQLPVVVRGGSLTRSPDGRLCTLQAHGIYPSPQTVQDVWASASRQRYPKAWEGQALERVGYIIEWEKRGIACRCGRSLGDYVAYRIVYPDRRVHDERGIVEKTSRRYEQQAARESRQAATRGPKSQPRFRLEGQIGRHAAKTTAYFHCPGCKREHRRNLARLGTQLYEHPDNSPFVLD
jgi:hypothetical protein